MCIASVRFSFTHLILCRCLCFVSWCLMICLREAIHIYHTICIVHVSVGYEEDVYSAIALSPPLPLLLSRCGILYISRTSQYVVERMEFCISTLKCWCASFVDIRSVDTRVTSNFQFIRALRSIHTYTEAHTYPFRYNTKRFVVDDKSEADTNKQPKTATEEDTNSQF